jgi:cytochrome b6-f complex iron-sulfur subunit
MVQSTNASRKQSACGLFARVIYALRAVCTHLGCTPNWLPNQQVFKCPCHGSGYYKSGINYEGPTPRPLERLAIGLAGDGQIEVDTSRTFRYEKGEWRDPRSVLVSDRIRDRDSAVDSDEKV